MPASADSLPLDSLRFDNRFVRELPGDPEPDNFRRQVYASCYSKVTPSRVKNPRLVAYAADLAPALGIAEEVCRSDDFCQVFAGNRLADGMEPFAMGYGGHQFGHWAGQLGDGRAINLGEVICPDGSRQTLQLKGAGLTPYSRSADGLAVLRSSIREFLCSEAMHHLGVPTTRALSVVLTGETVVRDMFYDGNPQLEPGAIVCRVAPSFVRFGNFQLFTARDDLESLKALVDYTIRNDFPELGEPCTAVYLQWFAEVCRKTADMVVHWQRVGFVHGVMNTDNMSILGLTIDYGPYGWLENYDPDWTPNTTDAQGRRYRYGNQPKIAYWNLVQLANALYPLVKRAEGLQQALQSFTDTFDRQWQATLAAKLGLSAFDADAGDEALTHRVLKLLQNAETDMTLFFRQLADVDIAGSADDQANAEFIELLQRNSYETLSEAVVEMAERWFGDYRKRLLSDGLPQSERREIMNRVNPKYVLRNYLAQQAIDLAEQGDFSLVWELLDLLRAPYAEQPERDRFAAKRPDWAKERAGCSMLSCSS
ncbi:protein adenylyltransferase SelO [Methylomonas sp. MED-D]|uniref:protein adenylyltransferase SelO n=1 Tax=unclassified Methylomonas TaxID=2608980 RepID=UPI0028A3C384|nr:YdiU family protein [Methylomonas sp. MV1]MDT4330561.1 YdiU family protein [Methylomonas sp. MV1]